MSHPQITRLLAEEHIAALQAQATRASIRRHARAATPSPWASVARLFHRSTTGSLLTSAETPATRYGAGAGPVEPQDITAGSSRRLRVIAIPGSLRRDSFNRRLLEVARAAASPALEIVIFDGLKAIPAFDEDDEADPPVSVVDLRGRIRAADAVLIATPEYNSSLPGQLKNALDWASRPHRASVLQDKPAAVIGASPSPFGAVRAAAAARQVLSASGARVVEEGLAVPRAFQAFDPAGQLSDPTQAEQLQNALRALAHAVEAGRELPAA
jgi:chromate reductase